MKRHFTSLSALILFAGISMAQVSMVPNTGWVGTTVNTLITTTGTNFTSASPVGLQGVDLFQLPASLIPGTIVTILSDTTFTASFVIPVSISTCYYDLRVDTGAGVITGIGAFFLMPCDTTEIAELQGASELPEVYPNPTSGSFHIIMKSDWKRLEIYNVLGERIHSEDNPGQGTKDLDLGKLADGVYYIRMQDGARVFSKRFVKAN